MSLQKHEFPLCTFGFEPTCIHCGEYKSKLDKSENCKGGQGSISLIAGSVKKLAWVKDDPDIGIAGLAPDSSSFIYMGEEIIRIKNDDPDTYIYMSDKKIVDKDGFELVPKKDMGL